MKVRQVELAEGNTRTIVWIPSDLKHTPGTTLQDRNSRVWTVVQSYKTLLNVDEINHGWKVGGLD